MKDFEKYFDLINEKSPDNMTREELDCLENELGNMNEYMRMEERIVNSLNQNEAEPSARVKRNLDAAFERKFSTKNSSRHGIISISAFQKSSPWKILATAASITIVLFLSVQIGFKGNHPSMNTSPYLADSIESDMPDSNYWPADTLIMP